MVQEEDKLLKFFEALQIVIEIVISSKFLSDLANIRSKFGNNAKTNICLLNLVSKDVKVKCLTDDARIRCKTIKFLICGAQMPKYHFRSYFSISQYSIFEIVLVFRKQEDEEKMS